MVQRVGLFSESFCPRVLSGRPEARTGRAHHVEESWVGPSRNEVERGGEELQKRRL